MSIKYDVIVKKVPIGKEFCVAQWLHCELNLDLEEAEHMTRSVPITVMERASEDAAMSFKHELEALDSNLTVICKPVMNSIAKMLQISDDDLTDAHILDRYYLALTCANSTYKELQDSKKELVQYEKILKEAEIRAEDSKLGIVLPPLIPKLKPCTPISIERVQGSLNSFRSKMQKLCRFYEELRSDLSSFQARCEAEISELEAENNNLEKRIEINNKKIELQRKLIETTISRLLTSVATIPFESNFVSVCFLIAAATRSVAEWRKNGQSG